MDAESYVLREIARDPGLLSVVAEQLKRPEYFWYAPHVAIYRTMLGLATDGIAIDLKSLQRRLEAESKWEELSHVAGGLYRSVAVEWAGYSLESTLASITEKFRRRSLLVAVGEWYSNLTDPVVAVNTVRGRMQNFLMAYDSETALGILSLDEAAEISVQRLSERFERSKEFDGYWGVPFGFEAIDQILGGAIPGGLYVVGARPGVGKTAFMVKIATSISVQKKLKRLVRSAIFTIEMPVEQILLRMLSLRDRIDVSEIASGEADTQKLRGLVGSMGNLRGYPVWLDETPGLKLSDLRTRARRLVEHFGVEIIFIDYLGKIETDLNADRREQVGHIVRSIKNLARELKIPILLFSQLNRASQLRADKRPGLADLRDSGEVEQEADAVILLHRPEAQELATFDDGTSAAGMAELIAAKHRHGKTGAPRVRWIAEFATFAEPMLHDGQEVIYDPEDSAVFGSIAKEEPF